jgi:hypothetical protein
MSARWILSTYVHRLYSFKNLFDIYEEHSSGNGSATNVISKCCTIVDTEQRPWEDHLADQEIFS